MINLFEPTLGSQELNAVEQVFNSKWIGKGENVKRFEAGFAKLHGLDPEHFLSTTSCTEGIFLACDLLNLTAGDEVIVPTISFPSVGSAVKKSGATIVFCDVDSRSLNVGLKHFKKLISRNTKAIFITHYGGFPCEMNEIIEFCAHRNICIIEDAACAVKSTYRGKSCGTLGDIGIWSFDAMKTLCTGDGGMIYFKSKELKKRAQELLYLGLPISAKSGLDSSKKGLLWWEFDIVAPGRRAIMNDITGAIGCVQLERLPEFIKIRKLIFEKYIVELTGVGDLRLPRVFNEDEEYSYYFFWIQTERRDELAQYLLSKNIYTTFRYYPLNKLKFFGASDVKYPNSDFAAQTTLNIPIHQGLANSDVDVIIFEIKRFFSPNI